MAKISFYLTNPKAKNETPLFCLINYGLFEIIQGKKKYLPLKYYFSNISLLPKLWNSKLGRAVESLDFASDESFSISKEAVKKSAKENYDRINNDLLAKEIRIKALIDSHTIDGVLPSHEILRAELDKIYKPHKQIDENHNSTPLSLFEFIEHYISTSCNRTGTIKSYRMAQNNLIEYQKKLKTKKLTFENIDIDFYNSFIDFLKKKNYATNTIGTRIKILKTILNSAHDRNILVNQDYTKKAFKKPKEDVDHIYLSETELDAIYNIESTPDFKERLIKKHNGETLPEYLDRAKDLFLIGCYTGLRFSDLSQLKQENFLSDNTIQVKTIKTGQEVVIPIHPIVKEILIKYNHKMPKVPLNQVFNRFIKDIGYLAGISENICTEITKGGLLIRENTPKYNLIASHTARRSFATNAFLAGMPSISIMKITGHKTESAFMKYLKMSAKDNAIKMQTHPFFNRLIKKGNAK